MKIFPCLLAAGLICQQLHGKLPDLNSLLPDSIGIRQVNGKSLVVHRVNSRETLWAISARYHIPVSVIKDANSLHSDVIQVGQIILVPSKTVPGKLSLRDYATGKPEVVVKVSNTVPVVTPVAVISKKASPVEEADVPGFHKVREGESLYGIALKYKVRVPELLQWNKLEGDRLRTGQTLRVSQEQEPMQTAKIPVADVRVSPAVPVAALSKAGKEICHVVAEGETLFGISQKYGLTIRELRLLNRLEDTDVQQGDSLRIILPGSINLPLAQEADVPEMKNETMLVVAENVTGKLVAPVPVVRDSMPETPMQKFILIPDDVKKEEGMDRRRALPVWYVEEEGLAGKMPTGTETDRKFYAHHRFLPEGTVIRVEYPHAKQAITVEIRGKTDSDSPEIILLSAKAISYLMFDETEKKVILRYSVPRDPGM